MVDDGFVEERTAEVPLADGGRIVVRPIVPEDKEALVRGFERLSARSRRFRFFQSRDSLTDEEIAYLTEIDYVDHFAWVAIDPEEGEGSGVGVARYIRSPGEPDVAEPAITVVDDHQGRGIGGTLLALLAESAVSNGIHRFRAEVLGDNTEVMQRIGDLARVTPLGEGVLSVELDLPIATGGFRSSSGYELLRRVAAGEVVPRPLRWHDDERSRG
jgi:RimJ/RimL family protein N-acetyltransferase